MYYNNKILSDERQSIAKLFSIKKWNVDIKEFEKKLITHPDYSSLLAYYETLECFNINCQIVKISDYNINYLPFPALALIRNDDNCNLTVINNINNKLFIFKDNKLTKISFHKLKEIWLGIVILFIEEEDFEFQFTTNEIDNSINIDNEKKFGKIIGIRNSFVDENDSRNIYLNIIGNDNRIIFEKNSYLNGCKFKIIGNKNLVKIENDCRINGDFIIEGNNSHITIGNHTTIEYATFSATESRNIEIGNDCMFSDNITLKTSDSHSIIDLNTNKRINMSGNIIIKDHVWINPYVNIFKNVIVDSNSIIGTASVVTKFITNNCLYAGVPAKLIKSNVTWHRDLFD